MEHYMLGIDVGTSSVKVGLFTLEGRTVQVTSESYPLSSPCPGWAEQRAEDWWSATAVALRQVTADIDPSSVAAVGFSNAGGSMVMVDEQGQPLGPVIVWMDARADEQGEELVRDLGRDFWVERTGQAAISYWPVAKLVWMRQNRPGVLRRTARVLQGADYVIYRMSGEMMTDRCNACATGVYNIIEGTWDQDILAAARLPESILPELWDSGTVAGTLTGDAANHLDLRPGIPVVLGAWDQACVVVGAGSVSDRDGLLSTGTAWVMCTPVRGPHLDPEAQAWTVQHALLDQYLLMIAMSNGGSVVEWYRKVFAGSGGGEKEAEPLESGGLSGLPAGVTDVSCGSEGVLVLPHLIGAVGPHSNPDFSGCILGLRHGTKRRHIFRAILEAVAYETRWSLETLSGLGVCPSQLRMVGGATRSPIWPQIVSHVTDLDVLIPSETEYALLGAVSLARQALGLDADPTVISSSIRRSYESDPEAVLVYDAAYDIYKDLHSELEATMTRIEPLRDSRSKRERARP